MTTNLFLSVFELSISMSPIVIVLILFDSFLNKRYVAKWKYWVWIFLALRLSIPLDGSNMQSFLDVCTKAIESVTYPGEEKQSDIPLEEHVAQQRIIVEVPAQMTTPVMAQSEKRIQSVTWLDIAAFIWLGGVLLFIGFHMFTYRHYKKRIVKEGTFLEDSHILQQVSCLLKELQIKYKIPVMEYMEAASPMIIGFVRPVLVLPKEQYNGEELFFILKHELIHLKRHDVYFKLLLMVANAVHWFNPLIWIMQKEACVDMELSCDEKVIQGTEYMVRKAYTETLFSTLHRKYVKTAVLSTQFYGGKQIMKKRFRNILTGPKKKGGFPVLVCVVLLTISMGTMVGCSVGTLDQLAEGSVADGIDVPEPVLDKAKELVAEQYLNAQEEFADYQYSNWRIESLSQCYTYEDFDNMVLQVYRLNYEFFSDKPKSIFLAGGMTVTEDGWVVPDYPDSRYLIFRQDGETLSFLICLFENDCLPGDEIFTNDLKQQLMNLGVLMDTGEKTKEENTRTLTFFVEGETEQRQATLATGDGYSLYLPDGDWQQSGSDTWTATANEQVQIWGKYFENQSVSQVEKELEADGYVTVNYKMWKQEGEMIYSVILKESGNDVWGIFYCFPVDCEEGFGKRIPVIVDTFAVSEPADGGQIPEDESDGSGKRDDSMEIERIVGEFATAYFSGDVEKLAGFLTSPYEEDVTAYEGTGIISDMVVKGLDDMEEQKPGSRQPVSLEFRDSEYSDTLWYLSFTFVKEADGWKIESYGLEL